MKLKKILALVLAAALLLSCVSAIAEGSGSVAGKDGRKTLINYCSNRVQDMGPFTQRMPSAAVALVYMRLAYEDADGSLVSDCCESIEQLDNRTFQVKLYDYIVDTNGNPFTANDLVFCMQKTKEAGFANEYMYFDHAEVVDDYTAKIYTNCDMSSAFKEICHVSFLVTEKSFNESPDHMADHPVGFTQYRVTEMVPSSYIDYERVDEYWQKDPAKISRHYEANVDCIHYIMLAEPSQKIAGLRTGDIQLVGGVDYTSIRTLSAEDHFTVLPVYNTTSMKDIAFNMSEKGACANDVNLRKAIFYAIDRQAMVDAFGQGVVLKSLVPNVYRGYNPEWDNEEYYEYNVEKAAEYLAKSNYKPGTKLRLLTNPGSELQTMTDIVIACLMEIGIEVTPVTFEAASYAKAQFASAQEYDICFLEIGASNNDIYDGLSKAGADIYSDIPGTTKYGWSNQELIDLCTKAATFDGRDEAIRDRIHEICRDEAVLLGSIMREEYCIYVDTIDEVYLLRGIAMPNATHFSQDYDFFKD